MRPWLRSILVSLVLAGVYAATARLGLTLPAFQTHVTLIWPPSGIALAAVLLLGYRVWPGLVLGAALAYWSPDTPLLFVVITAVGNPAAALLGAYVLRTAISFDTSLGRVRDVIGFFVFGVALSTMVSASIGSAGLLAVGLAEWMDLGRAWRLWWIGDAMGVLIITPVILTWTSRSSGVPPRRWKMLEGTALVLSLVVACNTVYGGWLPRALSLPLTFVAFPFVIWAALRFGQRGSSASSFLVVALALLGMFSRTGPFHQDSLNFGLVYLCGFNAALVGTALLLGAALRERRRAEDELREVGKELERRVEERTAALNAELEVRIRAEQGQERLLQELQGALAHVKTLSGLLPICSVCKKIRDDQGYWTQVERYISDHTDAQFSHGICPDCLQRVYPEYANHTGHQNPDAPPPGGNGG
jgi:integral membrane sensor domain MASE1